MTNANVARLMSQRFRGFLPVVIDLETGGFNARGDAILEIGATLLTMDDLGQLLPDETLSVHIEPFEGANIEQSALDFTGIRLDSALRQEAAVSETQALGELFKQVRRSIKSHDCNRAILVGHNAAFDLGFLNAAIERCGLKRSPFHPFSSFDTATLSGLAYGQTVLARACAAAGIPFDQQNAHAAGYDAERTAELFCAIVNRYSDLGGWALTLREQALDERA
ncbi:ribonuclease T [Halotalea alkalilenta]|uniref:Ribonuclease T n=1 Tax=Halotalea alkalilenta TaxID=376489 RepID=A0A172YEB6_9GAMM|nr:ribonuclease T [Halotalea alkalilenta]ANF57610.1 ribonuclease T [Halotalea alkalilenta]